MDAFTAAGAGFLLAVLWFDLMFDTQLLGHREKVPDSVLASISGYYRRVTTDARPMNRLVAAVMVATVASVIAEVAAGRGPRWGTWLSLVLAAAAVSIAASRTVPRAIRLGAGRDPLSRQALLARSILLDHAACLGAVAALLLVQLIWVR